MNRAPYDHTPAAGGDCGCGCGHDETRAPAPLHNPPGRNALDLRTGDHAAFLAAMLDRLASPAHPALRELTARTTDDPAVALLDAWAVLGDVLTFHSERAADEGYLRTAREPESLALLARLVGHRPRPGVASATHLAYTVESDPRAGEDAEILIPRGSRSHSVPTATEEGTHTFETDTDLCARAAWNRLPVRRRRPSLLLPADLDARSELFVAGTADPPRTGDRLLCVFGDGTTRFTRIAGVRTDRAEGITALRFPQSPPRSLAELVGRLRSWITVPAEEPAHEREARTSEEGSGSPEAEKSPVPNPRPVSRLIDDFDAQVLAPLRAALGDIGTPAGLVARLAGPRQRLAEAEALAAPYRRPAAWFAALAAQFTDLAERAAELGPAGVPEEGEGETAEDGTTQALRVLDSVLPALTGPARTSPRRPAAVTAGAAQLLGARTSGGARELYRAWRGAEPAAAPPPAEALRELHAFRVTAAPFGSTAPLKPVRDEQGNTGQQTDWPLTGAELTSIRVVFDTAGKVPERAELGYARFDLSRQRTEALPADTAFALGPGRVELHTRTGPDHTLGWLSRRPETPQEPGVTLRLLPGLPERTVFVSRPDETGAVQVAVHNGETVSWQLRPGEEKRQRQGDVEVTARCTTRSSPASVEIGLATVPDAAQRTVLRLDGVHDTVEPGSRIVVTRPRKGADGPGGIPGDPALARVTTRVTAVRTASWTDYGITGRGTELTLADPWLDDHDVLLSHIRDTTVHTAGTRLRPADEPLDDDVHGDRIALGGLYDGLGPGRVLAVTGERTDIPGTRGVEGTELAVVARAEPVVDPRLPGDRVHTRLVLTAGLEHRYRRDTVRILGNVVAATHGESREEAVGSGDAARTHQSFSLWQSPLTWLPDDNPSGARPALEIRVDGLRWHRVDSLAGRGPAERVYTLGITGDGHATVTFGDGVHGARLPTGHENVRARYRSGTGSGANLPAHRITQPVTRPLGVTGVTNPVPATGGCDPDQGAGAAAADRGRPGRMPASRRRIPLAVSALDRLVSVRDYEDFARSRAGIGRASARELTDGRRRLLHLTVTGEDGGPLDEDGVTLRALRSALASYGDPRLPVRVDVREAVLLVAAATVKTAPDHAWHLVEPALRRALLHELGFPGRELGVPARPSDLLAAAHTVPGVDRVDLDVFTGVPEDTPAGQLAGRLARPGRAATVPARTARFAERFHRVVVPGGETLTRIAADAGLPVAELLRLNPDITDTRRLPRGRRVRTFRGIRPAQLALLTPDAPATLVLTEVHP